MSEAHKRDRDLPFHFEIWREPQPEFGEEQKAIYYVENHNAQCGYAEVSTDFEMTTRAILATYRESHLGNWMAPLAHLARQTLELMLKSLVMSIRERGTIIPRKILGGHDLHALWAFGTGWLDANGFNAKEDARRASAAHLIEAYGAIDPSGDLFRFGVSYQKAFGKQKSYDRVGIVLDRFEREFDAATGFLSHWETVVFRRTMAEAEGWQGDPHFKADDFPRIGQPRR